MPDQFGAGFSSAMNEDSEAGIETAFNKQMTRENRRQGRELRGLDEDRISGEQSRERVGNAQQKWIIPRRDQPDQPIRFMNDFSTRNEGNGRTAALCPKMLSTVCEVISSGAGYSDQFSQGIATGLACFRLDRIQDLFPPVQNEIVKSAEDLGALCNRQLLPTMLGVSRLRCGVANVARRRNRHTTDEFTSCRISNIDRGFQSQQLCHGCRLAIIPRYG